MSYKIMLARDDGTFILELKVDLVANEDGYNLKGHVAGQAVLEELRDAITRDKEAK